MPRSKDGGASRPPYAVKSNQKDNFLIIGLYFGGRRGGMTNIFVFYHQTNHHGQVTTLFFQAGIDPSVTDLLALLMEK